MLRLFWATKRGKIAMFIILSGIVGIVDAPLPGVICILIGLCLLVPEIIYLLIPAPTCWSMWNEALSSNAQKTRLKRAISGELTPYRTNIKFKTAIFVGSEGGKYLTTLKKYTF